MLVSNVKSVMLLRNKVLMSLRSYAPFLSDKMLVFSNVKCL